jgi:hypothetical protein
MITLTRYFETKERLNQSLQEIDTSKFFVHHSVKRSGEFLILNAESNLSLYDVKTKFPDALEVK